MYINSDQRSKLAQNLFDKMIELKSNRVKSVREYEVAFQDIIENAFPHNCWREITDCQIFDHLVEHKNPEATVIAILKELKG